MRKIGKKGRAWIKARSKLKKEFEAKGITSCEVNFKVCWRDNALGFAHRHKRHWYNTRPELLGNYYHAILACSPCHQKIEYNAELTKEVFAKLRNNV